MRTLHYDPTDDATRRNPFPLDEALQAQDPVHWSEALRAWVVTRYEDVRAVTTSPAMSSDRLTPFYESQKDERRDILSGVLARLEARVCIGGLVARFPSMHYGAGPVDWIDALIMRGPKQLPVALA
ncbi:MAG: hypothetical protein LH632_21280 [Rhodoferax sp.]|nr:hypothetical protein [Rhodoferax sp.]